MPHRHYRFEIAASPEDLGARTAALLTGGSVALSGGDTYARLLPHWVGEEAVRKCSFFPADERRVPFTDLGSNWRMVYEKLLLPAGLEDQKEHFAESGPQYEALLERKLGPAWRFDLVFLGMGDDGHTASLFPGGAHLKDRTGKVLETEAPKAPHPRITLGLRALWEARQIVAVFTNPKKAPVLQRVLDGDESLPMTMALSGHPAPSLLLDREIFAALEPPYRERVEAGSK